MEEGISDYPRVSIINLSVKTRSKLSRRRMTVHVAHFVTSRHVMSVMIVHVSRKSGAWAVLFRALRRRQIIPARTPSCFVADRTYVRTYVLLLHTTECNARCPFSLNRSGANAISTIQTDYRQVT